MKRPLALAGCLVLLAGCAPATSATTVTAPVPTIVVTENRTPTPAPTSPTPSTTASTATSSAPPASATPSAGPSTTRPTAATTFQPTSYPSVADAASIYYIARDDGGPLGCGDTAVAAIRVPSTNTPVRDAMTQLLADHSAALGESGLSNSLADSRLTYVDGHVNHTDGRVDVRLSGTLVPAGDCDIARIRAQLELTALSAAGVDKVMVWINDVPLAKALDQRG